MSHFPDNFQSTKNGIILDERFQGMSCRLAADPIHSRSRTYSSYLARLVE